VTKDLTGFRPGRLRAVVVPHPPLLAPELTGPGAADAEPLRASSGRAVRDLVAGAGRGLVIVGTGTVTRVHEAGAWGTLAGYGAAVEAPQDAASRRARPPSLPLSLTVGCRLVDLAGANPPPVEITLQEVAADAGPQECRRLGASLAALAPDAAWLVLGDGTTGRTERAPGAFDARAEPYDADVVEALASGCPERVLALDTARAAELGAVGRAAWQVLAGAWEVLTDGRAAQAAIDYAAAPFGVGYVVARWCTPPSAVIKE
jgi:hypothetical protein